MALASSSSRCSSPCWASESSWTCLARGSGGGDGWAVAEPKETEDSIPTSAAKETDLPSMRTSVPTRLGVCVRSFSRPPATPSTRGRVVPESVRCGSGAGRGASVPISARLLGLGQLFGWVAGAPGGCMAGGFGRSSGGIGLEKSLLASEGGITWYWRRSTRLWVFSTPASSSPVSRCSL